MLFNSYAFIFVFLPIVLAGYFAAGPARQSGAGDLAGAGVAGVLFGQQLAVRAVAAGVDRVQLFHRLAADRQAIASHAAVRRSDSGRRRRSAGARHLQICRFLRRQSQCDVFDRLTLNILLPVGISFYTFTQIAFLVDAYRGNVARYALPHYALFVTYFPHLIAGPILHHKDMIPQFESERTKRPDPHLILCGLIIFAIGLFKKTCLADGIQPLVAPAFGANTPVVRSGLDRRAGLYLPALFRFLRLFRHGDRHLADVRHLPAAQFQLALQGNLHHRFLAALAHDAVAVPARLSLHSARRQPPWPRCCAMSI